MEKSCHVMLQIQTYVKVERTFIGKCCFKGKKSEVICSVRSRNYKPIALT